MKLSWQNALTVSACLTTLILSGCATSPGGRPELATHIPDAGERLAVRVAHPHYKKGTDVRIVLAKYAAVGGALDQANARLDAVRECMQQGAAGTLWSRITSTAHELTACASHQPSPSMLIASVLTSGRLLTLGEGAWRLQEDLLHTIVAQDDDHEIDLVTFLH